MVCLLCRLCGIVPYTLVHVRTAGSPTKIGFVSLTVRLNGCYTYTLHAAAAIATTLGCVSLTTWNLKLSGYNTMRLWPTDAKCEALCRYVDGHLISIPSLAGAIDAFGR